MMGSITRIALLAVVGMLMGQYRVSEACSCVPEHPQVAFCNADYVGVVKLKQVVTVNPNQKTYEFEIVETFKSTMAADHALAEAPYRVWSPSIFYCPPSLILNEEQLVTGHVNGNKLMMSSCDISKSWSNVSHRERVNFRESYTGNCGCPIHSAPWGRQRPVSQTIRNKRCLWDNAPGPNDCQERFGVCVNNQGVCGWERSEAYNECISGSPN